MVRFSQSRGIFALMAVCAVVSACSHNSSSAIPAVGADKSAPVAVFGDSQGELLQNAQTINSSGKQAIYVSVKATNKEYLFSVYSQMLRSAKNLIVIGYGHLYVFPLSTPQVLYGTTAISLMSLPLVDAPLVDKVTDGRQPAAFVMGAVKTKADLCPDCVMLLLNKKFVAKIADRWSGELDPWQQSPTYVAWMPTPTPPARSGIKPMLSSGGGGGGGWRVVNVTFSVGAFGSCYISGVFASNPTYCSDTSATGGGGTPAPTPTPECVLGTNPLSVQRITSSTFTSSDQRKAQQLQSQVIRNSIPDSMVEANIDPQIRGADRAYVRRIMLTLPPTVRTDVAGIDPNGHFFSNRQADYISEASTSPWRDIGNGLWLTPRGEVAALPVQSRSVTGSIRTFSVPPCPPPGLTTSGVYVRGFSCGLPDASFTATVNASGVGGPPGQSWCITPANNLAHGDTGYLIVGAWSDQSKTAEGGLQWSPHYMDYAMFAKDDGNFPDPGIPQTWSFQPDFFSLKFGTTSDGNFYISVSTLQQGQHTWTRSGLSSQVGLGSSWTYKEETSIAQNFLASSDGSYFGVSPAFTPLFSWSTMQGSDYSPDTQRAIQNGWTWGIWLKQ